MVANITAAEGSATGAAGIGPIPAGPANAAGAASATGSPGSAAANTNSIATAGAEHTVSTLDLAVGSAVVLGGVAGREPSRSALGQDPVVDVHGAMSDGFPGEVLLDAASGGLAHGLGGLGVGDQGGQALGQVGLAAGPAEGGAGAVLGPAGYCLGFVRVLAGASACGVGGSTVSRGRLPGAGRCGPICRLSTVRRVS